MPYQASCGSGEEALKTASGHLAHGVGQQDLLGETEDEKADALGKAREGYARGIPVAGLPCDSE